MFLSYFVKLDWMFFCISFEYIFELIFYQFHAFRVPVVRLELASSENAEV